MLLTMFALPFLILGIFITPYSLANARCFSVSFVSKSPFCFELASNMPEIVKYGSLLLGFALIYLGRQQIRRARGSN
jgi:hypothetical protein